MTRNDPFFLLFISSKGKAKKLLSKQEEQSGEVVDDIIDVTDERPVGPITTSACVGGFDVSSWPPQELGKCVNT